MQMSVIPLCTVDRNRPGSAARSSAHFAPRLPLLASAFNRASREDTTASSLIDSTPFKPIRARMRRTSSQGMGAKWSLIGGALSVTFYGACSQAATQYRCGTISVPRRFHRRLTGELIRMMINRTFKGLVIGGALAAVAGCQTAPPPVVVPASFTPLGVSAPYLMGDVIGGQKTRAAKMRAAK